MQGARLFTLDLSGRKIGCDGQHRITASHDFLPKTIGKGRFALSNDQMTILLIMIRNVTYDTRFFALFTYKRLFTDFTFVRASPHPPFAVYDGDEQGMLLWFYRY